MSDKTVKLHSRCILWAISFVLAAGLVLPLQTETSSATSSVPGFSNKSVIYPKKTPLKKAKKVMNLRLEANQGIGGCDTIQGSCYGDGYIFYLLNDRIRDRCKIVKMKRSNLKVVKVTKPMSLNHGNDITYNNKTKKLVVSNSKPSGKVLSVINSRTLKLEKKHTIKLSKKVPGINWSRVKKKGYDGFNCVAYNQKHDQYVVQLYNSRDFLFLDSKFDPVRYVVPTDWDSQMYQGIDSFGDRIVVCNSYTYGKPNNLLSVYNWKGKYLSKVNLGKGMELESVFHQGNKLYVSYYTSYIAGYKWIVKSKKVRKKVKVKVKKKIRFGKNRGKYKYVTKTKKKKVTVRYYAKHRKLGTRFLNRDGYIYRVTNL